MLIAGFWVNNMTDMVRSSSTAFFFFFCQNSIWAVD
jgi:hypothetical protein